MPKSNQNQIRKTSNNSYIWLTATALGFVFSAYSIYKFSNEEPNIVNSLAKDIAIPMCNGLFMALNRRIMPRNFSYYSNRVSITSIYLVSGSLLGAAEYLATSLLYFYMAIPLIDRRFRNIGDKRTFLELQTEYQGFFL